MQDIELLGVDEDVFWTNSENNFRSFAIDGWVHLDSIVLKRSSLTKELFHGYFHWHAKELMVLPLNAHVIVIHLYTGAGHLVPVLEHLMVVTRVYLCNESCQPCCTSTANLKPAKD